MIPPLETERLLLRGFEERDLDSYARFTADAEVMRWMGRGPFDRAEAWREMAFFLGHWDLRGFGHWALELKHTGELVGRCGPYLPEGWPGLEVGWLLGREHWGRGYATEAASTALRYAWDELDAERVISLIAPGNERSARCLAGWEAGRRAPRGSSDWRPTCSSISAHEGLRGSAPRPQPRGRGARGAIRNRVALGHPIA